MTPNKEDYLKDLPIKSGDIFIPQKAIDGAQGFKHEARKSILCFRRISGTDGAKTPG